MFCQTPSAESEIFSLEANVVNTFASVSASASVLVVFGRMWSDLSDAVGFVVGRLRLFLSH